MGLSSWRLSETVMPRSLATAGAETAHHGLDDAERERRGHRRVHRVAALLQNGEAGLACVGITGRHHAVLGDDPLADIRTGRGRRRDVHARPHEQGACQPMIDAHEMEEGGPLSAARGTRRRFQRDMQAENQSTA